MDQIIFPTGAADRDRCQRTGIAMPPLQNATRQHDAATDKCRQIDRQEILQIESRAAQQLGQRSRISVILEMGWPDDAISKALCNIGAPPLACLFSRDPELHAPFSKEPRHGNSHAEKCLRIK